MEARQEWNAMCHNIGNPYHQLRRINECLDALGADYAILEDGVSNDEMCVKLAATFEQRKIGHYETPYKGETWFVNPRKTTSASSVVPQSGTPTPETETRSALDRSAYGSGPKGRVR